MKKALKIILWIVAFLLFPITAGLYFILSIIISKSKLSKGWRRFCWAIYGIVATCMVTYKALVFIVFHTMNTADTTPTISRENICPAPYRTSDDFYKLTGVKFPELEIVDSLYYDDMFLNPNTYHEYKFVVKEALKRARRKARTIPKSRGRKPAKILQEYKYENKRLKMENELLRDFLSLTERM